MGFLLRLPAGFLLALLSRLVAAAPPPPCNSNADCLARVGEGSECITKNAATQTTNSSTRIGVCSHPFPSGCLHGRLPGWKKKRVCNSDDPPDAAAVGICRESSDLDYMEIRLYSQGWESVHFENWILQILLSEMLDVPATIETATPDARIGLYDPDLPYDYGLAGDHSVYERAAEIGDCRLANRDPANYEACAHFNPELWNMNNPWVLDLVDRSKLETPQGMGILGREGLYIFKFSAVEDPSLVSYLGFAGEENRRKLAKRFKRPTTWKDYCEQVSANNCTAPDSVAARGPADAAEAKRYFVEGAYTGHFRMTEENDCDANPTTCTGHVVDFPCKWDSFVTQQVYHLGIAMSSSGGDPGGGYQLSAMTEILQAANATRSDIFIMWWEPEAFYRSFIGTETEMIRVTLPPTTQECEDARTNARCSSNATLRRGTNPAGACDEAAEPLRKAIVTGLYQRTYDPSIPMGKQSPAYEVLNRFQVTNLQLYDIFAYWFAKPSPRSALCDWVVDNVDYLQGLAPRTYPRVLQHENRDGLMYASTSLGGIAVLLVTWTIWNTHLHRRRRAIRAAQVEFLWLLLAGLLTISAGAIVLALPPSNASCVAAMWLINFGYVFELVPLIVKVAAINRLMNAARHMRRVVLRRQSLFGSVVMMNGFVVLFLVVWTILDPLQKKAEYELTDSTTVDGETIVIVHNYCASRSEVWQFAAVSINVVLLLCATVLAFQTRNLRQDFNETQTLAVMIYSHFVFLVLRVITFFLTGFVSGAVLAHCQSLIFSIDIMVTILIYFVPKFVAREETFWPASDSEFFGSSSFNVAGSSGRRGQLLTNFIKVGGVVHRIIAQLSVVSTAEAMDISEHEERGKSEQARRVTAGARAKAAPQKQPPAASISEEDKLESDVQERSFCCTSPITGTPSGSSVARMATREPSSHATSAQTEARGRSIEILFTSTSGTNSTSEEEFGNVMDCFLSRKLVSVSFEETLDDHTGREAEKEANDADYSCADVDTHILAGRCPSDTASENDDEPDESGQPDHGFDDETDESGQPDHGFDDEPDEAKTGIPDKAKTGLPDQAKTELPDRAEPWTSRPQL